MAFRAACAHGNSGQCGDTLRSRCIYSATAARMNWQQRAQRGLEMFAVYLKPIKKNPGFLKGKYRQKPQTKPFRNRNPRRKIKHRNLACLPNHKTERKLMKVNSFFTPTRTWTASLSHQLHNNSKKQSVSATHSSTHRRLASCSSGRSLNTTWRRRRRNSAPFRQGVITTL